MDKNSRERLEYGKRYYFLQMDGSYNSAPDERNLADNMLYKANNYFYTKQDAEEASEEFRKFLQRVHNELKDFEWALIQLRKGKKITRRSYRILKGYEYDYWQMVNGVIMQYLLTPEHFYMEVEYFCFSSENDIFATDWEIYNEK